MHVTSHDPVGMIRGSGSFSRGVNGKTSNIAPDLNLILSSMHL